MTKRFRKFISILCALALLAACMGTAFATEEPPVETPDEEVTEVVTGEEPGEEPSEAPGEEPVKEAGDPEGTGDNSGTTPQEAVVEDVADPVIPDTVPEEEGTGTDGTGNTEDPDQDPSGDEPGTTEVVSEPTTLEEALEEAGEDQGTDALTTEEDPSGDVTPPAENEEGQESDSQETPSADENQIIEPEYEPGQDNEEESKQEEEQEDVMEDEPEDESKEEPDDGEDLIVLKLGERVQVSSVVTKGQPYSLKAVDDYSRIMLFTLAVPENSVSVTVNDTPITLNKAEDENPEDENVTYTFEYPILQGSEYIITLNAEQDGYIIFDLSMEKKPDEELKEKLAETIEKSTDEDEKDEETDSGLEDGEAKQEFVLPDDRSVDFTISFDEEEPTIGCVAHFKAQLSGYEGIIYSLQWQKSLDCEEWIDEVGADQETMDVLMTDESSQYYWRLKVIIDITENI